MECSSRRSSRSTSTRPITARSNRKGSGPPQGLVHNDLEALAEALLSDVLDVGAAGEEGVDDLGVPLDARALAEDLVDLQGGEASAVGAGARHGVEGVGDGQDPRLGGDRVAGQARRVARAVE